MKRSPGKQRVKRKGHPLYVKTSIEIYPGSLHERSIERLVDDATEKQVQNDMRLSGMLAEEFVDSDWRIASFSRPNGKGIFWLLRRIMMEHGRIGDPIPGKELERLAIEHGFFRIHARLALRDAWKQGISRRFVRGVFNWAKNGESNGGQKFGIHYMLIGSKNANKAT